MPDLVTYGLVAKLSVRAQPPGNVTAGASFGVLILVENAAGVVDQNFGGNVTVSLDSNPGGGSLGGAVTATAQNGVATFSGLTLLSAGVGYTLLATVGSEAVLTSGFTVTPAAPARLAVISEPPFRIGVSQAFGLSVAVEDRFGNVENTYAGAVMVSLASGPGGSTLRGTLTANVINGVVVFGNLKLNRIGLGYSIKVSSQLALGPRRPRSSALCPICKTRPV